MQKPGIARLISATRVEEDIAGRDGVEVGDAAYALGSPPFAPLRLVVGRCHRSGLMAAGPAAG
jgi:hypothetical protein